MPDIPEATADQIDRALLTMGDEFREAEFEDAVQTEALQDQIDALVADGLMREIRKRRTDQVPID